MREWDAPELADILVSELLGSFGDNELSPECLDGARRFLKRDGGISIPAEYVSLAAPLSSQKLHMEVRNFRDDKAWEMPYVACLHNHALLAEPRPCMHFRHPEWAAAGAADAPPDNRRHALLRFRARSAGLVHGFAGYFECRLYRDVFISIAPETHSPGMFSWFPIFFPIRTPLYVREGDTIEIHVWRCVTPGKVWYEWAFTSPGPTEIHNSAARSYHIGTS
jgi:protein arginine N-methyltransferase 5